jgi:hypothetical protein
MYINWPVNRGSNLSSASLGNCHQGVFQKTNYIREGNLMFKCRVAAMGFAVLASSVLSAPGQAPSPGVKVGSLGCTMSPSVGLLIGSIQALNCRFTPDGPYPPEIYSGTMGTLGLDLGIKAGGLLGWGVYMQNAGAPRGALAGKYGGASGSIGVGLGVGANVLWGGSGNAVALQPISLEGSVRLEVTLGVSSLELRWVQ